MRLILIRHGQTEHNRNGITLGRSDVPLNERGRLQAEAVAAMFADAPLAIYSSPLARARDTAAAIASATGTRFEIEDALIEMDVGEMEHISHEDLRTYHADFLRAWIAAAGTARMPGGETLAEVQERAWPAVEQLRERHAGAPGEVVAVTHNFVILTIACRALGLPLDEFRRLKTSVGGRTVLDLGGARPTLIAWNDTGHLRAQGLD